jgi:hypothetical protein
MVIFYRPWRKFILLILCGLASEGIVEDAKGINRWKTPYSGKIIFKAEVGIMAIKLTSVNTKYNEF